MYEFINNVVDKEELLNQIKNQTNLGFMGYYEKKMLKGEETEFYKRAIQIITPKQSVFAIARDNYEDVSLTLLRALYNRELQDTTKGNKDIIQCVDLGNIYITEQNNDISTNDEKGLFHSIIKKICPAGEREFKIYIPQHINSLQLEEIYKIRRIRERYANKFKKNDSIQVYHYIDKEKPEIFNGEDAMRYLLNELPNYIDHSFVDNYEEQIINERFN